MMETISPPNGILLALLRQMSCCQKVTVLCLTSSRYPPARCSYLHFSIEFQDSFPYSSTVLYLRLVYSPLSSVKCFLRCISVCDRRVIPFICRNGIGRLIFKLVKLARSPANYMQFFLDLTEFTR